MVGELAAGAACQLPCDADRVTFDNDIDVEVFAANEEVAHDPTDEIDVVPLIGTHRRHRFHEADEIRGQPVSDATR